MKELIKTFLKTLYPIRLGYDFNTSCNYLKINKSFMSAAAFKLITLAAKLPI